MGIYLMRDMAGLDVSYRVRRNKAAAGELDMNSIFYNPIADRLCEDGDYGQKTGKGYYAYEGRNATPRPELEEKLRIISQEKGIERKPMTDEEIVWRILSAMVNEGAKIVEEGYAQRASDIDVAYAFGYGFPKYRGGPMFYADTIGLPKVLARIREFGWTPAPLLEKLVSEGRSFSQ